MRLGQLLVGAGAIVAGSAAACAFLDPPSQCATDDDCARFDAVCDVEQAICISREEADGGNGGNGGDGASQPSTDAADDAPSLPAECLVSPKPSASATMGLPAGPDGGAQVSGSHTLGCDKDWTLEGHLVVSANATLTIAAGTTIRAKKGTNAAIVVLRGGRIIADGMRDAPIVMTVDDPAPQAGDWRGLFILGNAVRNGTAPYKDDPLLQYGGTDPNDSSGSLSFVRVEYALDGIMFGAVGKGTKVDSVQVRHAADNCFIVNGGSFDAKHLVCQQTNDEQFELQQGYTGRMQFLFGQRVNPNDANHNGLLVDGENTSPIIYNATFCGLAEAQAPTVGHGIVFRNNAKLDLANALVTGWLSGLDAQSGNLGAPLRVRSSIFFGNAINPVPLEDGGAGPAADDDNGFDEAAFFAQGGNVATDPQIGNCHSPTAPQPWRGEPLSAGAIEPPNDGFFDTTAKYVGAFKDSSDGWMTGKWVRFAEN